ncbi:MAG: ATP-binding protein [Bacteroidetes bacterium]|nr:MAG: ATP-binding protein [Bacteroidota bacterium]
MTDILHHYTLPSIPESIAEVEKIIQEICDHYEIPEDTYGNILIAVTEAVNNAIYHGNKTDPNKKVSIQFSHNNKNYTFTISDEGNGFDYQNLPDPTLPENISKIGGRGIFIIHQLADQVKFKDNGKTIEIHFHIPVLAH